MKTRAESSVIELTPKKSASDVRNFVGQVSSKYLLDRPRYGVERRSAERMAVTIPVTITPLDDELKSLGYEFSAITRDISSLGIGLVTTNPIAPCFVLISIEPFFREPFKVIGRVVFCKDLGHYHQIGCEFFKPTT